MIGLQADLGQALIVSFAIALTLIVLQVPIAKIALLLLGGVFGGAVALPGLTIAFLIIALGGLYMETMADIQLVKFRADPNSGPLLDSGWWKYTRHPNYFGDAVFWWGIYGAVVAATPEAIWTIFAPIIMNYLLVNVSGAEMLERRLKHKPGYAEYMERTNRFIPKIW